MGKSRAAKKGRGIDRTGRSILGARFVGLPYWMIRGHAWQSLDCTARSLFVVLLERFNGSNNGDISLSQREAAKALHVRPDTAARAFDKLIERGFIRMARDSSFHVKARYARTWILTLHPYRDALATKDFMRWRPSAEIQNTDPKERTACPDPAYRLAG